MFDLLLINCGLNIKVKQQAHSCTFLHLLCRLYFNIPAKMKLDGSELGKSSDARSIAWSMWSIKGLKRKAIFLCYDIFYSLTGHFRVAMNHIMKARFKALLTLYSVDCCAVRFDIILLA